MGARDRAHLPIAFVGAQAQAIPQSGRDAWAVPNDEVLRVELSVTMIDKSVLTPVAVVRFPALLDLRKPVRVPDIPKRVPTVRAGDYGFGHLPCDTVSKESHC